MSRKCTLPVLNSSTQSKAKVTWKASILSLNKILAFPKHHHKNFKSTFRVFLSFVNLFAILNERGFCTDCLDSETQWVKGTSWVCEDKKTMVTMKLKFSLMNYLTYSERKDLNGTHTSWPHMAQLIIYYLEYYKHVCLSYSLVL